MSKDYDKSKIQKALVLTKAGYMGDTIVATPFLRALNGYLTGAEVTLLSGEMIPVLLQGCPYVSKYIALAKSETKGLGASLKLASKLKSAHFDIAYLLDRSFRSAFIAKIAGVPVRVGFDTEHRGALLTHRIPYNWNIPERDSLLSLLGINSQNDMNMPELWLSDTEREEAIRRLNSVGMSPGTRPIVAIHSGAHDPEIREWGAYKYARVGDWLIENKKARIILMGSPEEVPSAHAVEIMMRKPCVSFAGKTNIRQALGLIAACDLWIGNDGGMLHAAVALGTPTVGIFTPAKAKRWGYDSPKHKTLTHGDPSFSRKPSDMRAALDAITVQEAQEAAEAIMRIKN
jgi:heptosyltransferase-2